jgi:Transposase domain (DUF772)
VAFDLQLFVPADHPLRTSKRWADGVLAEISRDFNAAYGTTGWPDNPPERLIKTLLLQALHSISSKTKLVEAIQDNLLDRWFLDPSLAEDFRTQETLSMTRERIKRLLAASTSRIKAWSSTDLTDGAVVIGGRVLRFEWGSRQVHIPVAG